MDWLFNPSGLTAHGFCLSWAPGLVALHVVSDVVIGLAYFSIPLALAVFIGRRRDIKYGWIAYLFVAFILACGTSHLMSILTLWVPAYGIEGLIKATTAALSIATAVILWPLMPKILALPSTAELERVNAQLSATVEEQGRTAALLRESEAKARLLNAELEQRVAERTAELTTANAQLTEALAERTSAEQALARSEEEFRLSFEAAAVGTTQTDPIDGRIIRANRAFARMLGYEPKELIGRSIRDLGWPADLPSDIAEYDRVMAGEVETYVREKRYRRKDGEPVWARASAVIIRHPDGQPRLTIAVIEDIDQRHKTQAALEQAKRELEGVVDQRTTALAQRDLLLREVYHRVKNNLQIIDGMMVMKARQLLDPKAKEALLSLRSRIYALGLVHHQLMGSENLKTFDIAPFLQQLSHNIMEGAGRDIALSVRAIPLDVGLDFAIPLSLLVTELVTNSLKHAFPDGSGAIEVLLDKGEDGGVVLVVSDDGQGYGGVEPLSNAALGGRIIRGLVAQLKGVLVITKDNGSRSEITLKEPTFS